MYVYTGVIEEQVDGSYLIVFPSFPGCMGEGKTLQKAAETASDALRLVLAEYIDTGLKLPKNEFLKGDNAISFCVDIDDEFINYSKCMTVSEAACELGVTRGRVSQMLNSGVLEKFMYGGKRMVTITSVNRCKKLDRHPGRPHKSLVASSAVSALA